MKEKIVLGTDIASNGKVLFLFKGEKSPVWGSQLNGRQLPKSGDTVWVEYSAVKDKNGKPFTNVYW